ncbi:MAG: methyl-accepting chemotaxis protein [Steroidobacteraceae bacterium]|nr:methyl-accepting chemotaxis protein [Steroidobacteraceae bacterium]
MPLEAQSALRGDDASFDALAASLRASGDFGRAGSAAAAWRALADAVNAVEGARGAVQVMQTADRQTRQLTMQLASLRGPPAAAGAVGKMTGSGGDVEAMDLEAQRVRLDMARLAAGLDGATPAAQRLVAALTSLDHTARKLSVGPAGATQLSSLLRWEGTFAAAVRQSIVAAVPLAKAQIAAAALPRLTQALMARPAAQPAFGADRARLAILIALGIAFCCLVALAWVYRKAVDMRRTIELRVRENERNQEAIMRLLDELSNLADGDLTVQATVTEDITGAIADSINYAIEALRELVTTINDGAVQLDGAMRQAQTAAAHMAKASAAQSRQISAASESMAEMAASIEEVSGNSERCSDVARHSVDIAHKGGDAVRRTIDGMNAIRETIQETSKRIKRLGESSQEIGNIVELINDIAEQTNILALNASIQASMAGEAGRGFAVVADEVQRLAERAANATKQIEVLVRTIQTDTNEAVVSMERSTTDVVGGALLAENAGASLGEIEQVSNQIATLVQNISASARQQAASSGDISKNMQVVREISTQTAESSSATSASISKLAALAAQLRKSVTGFRLPDADGVTTTLVRAAAVRPTTAQPGKSSGGVASANIRKASGFGA